MNPPEGKNIKHISTTTHEGKVVVVGTDVDGEIWYTINQDGFEDSYLQPPDGQVQDNPGWEDWQKLALPDAEDDQSVIDRETEELTRQSDGSFILRSRYRTLRRVLPAGKGKWKTF